MRSALSQGKKKQWAKRPQKKTVGLAVMGNMVNVLSGCWMAAFYAMEYVWTTLGWNLKVPTPPLLSARISPLLPSRALLHLISRHFISIPPLWCVFVYALPAGGPSGSGIACGCHTCGAVDGVSCDAVSCRYYDLYIMFLLIALLLSLHNIFVKKI